MRKVFIFIVFLFIITSYFTVYCSENIRAENPVDYWLTNNFLCMHKKLATYREIKNSGGWPQIKSKDELKIGSRGEVILRLRKRLSLVGDLIINEKMFLMESYDPYYFDLELEKAVKKFQYRHGLEADGIVEMRTLEELNVPASKRVEQIRLNINEIKKVLEEKNNEFILVNIPDFKLRYIRKNIMEVKMKAIVGKLNKPTPVFTDEIEYLVVNPYWKIPIEKTIKEIIPVIRENPSYLKNKNIDVYESWEDNADELEIENINWNEIDFDNFKLMFRQRPGLNNEMGKVKFIFPNDYYIFIHGTPHRYLFKYKSRTFSSGCIRIEKPLDLARFILSDERRENINLTSRDLENILSGKERKRIDLKPYLAVYVVYWTSWVDEEGLLNFRKDIYNKHRN